jgi:multiple sugar transport system substrate-binding protein
MLAKFSKSCLGLLTILALAICFAAAPAMAEKKFGLDDIPPIKNKTPIHVALEAGGGADLIIPYIKKFAEKTGIKVTHESHVFASLYSKEIVELQGRTGAYDLVVTETSWTNEWEDYLYPVFEMAEKFDPKGVESLKEDFKGHDPGLLRMCSTKDGKLMGLPYYTYTMMTIYRQDLLEDPREKAAFKKKYGYELAPVQTWDQIRDQAEFFTRKKGEKLKGQPLKEDFYGASLMAGRFPHVQDEVTSMLWSKGGHWASPVRDSSGKLKAFKVTDKDKEAFDRCFDRYKKLMPFAPPGTENAFWDQATASFATGKTAMIPAMYTALWPWSATVAKEVPRCQGRGENHSRGAPLHRRLPFCPQPGQQEPRSRLLAGALHHLIRCPKGMLEKGWASVRTDVLWKTPSTRRRDGMTRPPGCR